MAVAITHYSVGTNPGDESKDIALRKALVSSTLFRLFVLLECVHRTAPLISWFSIRSRMGFTGFHCGVGCHLFAIGESASGAARRGQKCRDSA
jgi:hypothetical protein